MTHATTWAQMESLLPQDLISAVDQAVGEALSDCAPVRSDETYLVSERITWDVLQALLGVNVSRSEPTNTHRRGTCSECRRDVGLRSDGTTRTHNRGDGVFGRCPGSHDFPESAA